MKLKYWIELLYKTDYLKKAEYDSLFTECRDMTNILSRIILPTKNTIE